MHSSHAQECGKNLRFFFVFEAGVRKMALQAELCWIQWQYGICMKHIYEWMEKKREKKYKQKKYKKKNKKRFGFFSLIRYLLFRWGMIWSYIYIHLIIMIIKFIALQTWSNFFEMQTLWLMVVGATLHIFIHFVYVIRNKTNEKFAFLHIKKKPKFYNFISFHLIWTREEEKKRFKGEITHFLTQ